MPHGGTTSRERVPLLLNGAPHCRCSADRPQEIQLLLLGVLVVPVDPACRPGDP